MVSGAVISAIGMKHLVWAVAIRQSSTSEAVSRTSSKVIVQSGATILLTTTIGYHW